MVECNTTNPGIEGSNLTSSWYQERKEKKEIIVIQKSSIFRGGFVEHLSRTYVAQQSVTEVISLIFIKLVTP